MPVTCHAVLVEARPQLDFQITSMTKIVVRPRCFTGLPTICGATQNSDKGSIFGKLPQKRQLFFSDPQALQSGHVRFDRPGGAGPAYNGYKGALSVPPDWQN